MGCVKSKKVVKKVLPMTNPSTPEQEQSRRIGFNLRRIVLKYSAGSLEMVVEAPGCSEVSPIKL